MLIKTANTLAGRGDYQSLQGGVGEGGDGGPDTLAKHAMARRSRFQEVVWLH